MRRPHRRPHLLLLLFVPLSVLLLLLVPLSVLVPSGPPPSPPPALPTLAYLLSGTAGDGPALKRLLSSVHHPRNHYLLHLDAAAREEERADLRGFVEEGFGNAEVVVEADRVTEMGVTQVLSVLHGVAILMRDGKRWDWFLNLGVTDYPLITQHDILHIFSFLPRDLNFIEHTSEIGWKESQRVRPIIVDPGLYGSQRMNVVWARERRALPSSFKLFIGSSGMVLSRSFLEFCIWGWDNLPRTLLMYYTNFLSPYEAYFHSVICNSKDFQNTTVNHGLRFIIWDDPPKQHPRNLTEKDFNLMVDSGMPFGHGFPRGSPILDRIDEELLRRPAGGLGPAVQCNGRSMHDKDVCNVERAVVRPTRSSKRFEKLMLKVLDLEIFRSRQCA